MWMLFQARLLDVLEVYLRKYITNFLTCCSKLWHMLISIGKERLIGMTYSISYVWQFNRGSSASLSHHFVDFCRGMKLEQRLSDITVFESTLSEEYLRVLECYSVPSLGAFQTDCEIVYQGSMPMLIESAWWEEYLKVLGCYTVLAFVCRDWKKLSKFHPNAHWISLLGGVPQGLMLMLIKSA